MNPPEEALAAYQLGAAILTPIDGGLINKSWRVDTGGAHYVLQSLNKIFAPEVHEDIEAITAHLGKKGLETPRLVRSKAGALWTPVGGEVFRLFTFLAGETIHRLDSGARALGAGALVGRFHTALLDCQHAFVFTRPGAHDTKKHMLHLERALSEHQKHPSFAQAETIGQEILKAFSALGALPPLPLRVAHGDLKVSNILFRGNVGTALVDLDTLARLPLAVELGDALRSWCNPTAEDTAETSFDIGRFEAALRGYFSTAHFCTALERRSIVPGTMTIAIELAARFCADALEESYFGWNPQRFPSRSAHNLVRSAGQLNVFKSLRNQQAAAALVCERQF